MFPDKISKNSLITIILWMLFIVFTLFVAIRGNPNVAQWYGQGAQHWLHGLNLYNTATTSIHGSHSEAGTGFIYLPQAAIMYMPFSLFPPCAARILWRIALIILMLVMTYRLHGSIKQHSQYHNTALLSAVMIFLGVSSAITGQMNIVLVAFTLFATIAIAHEQWRQASLWLVLAFAAKPTAIVILLLAIGSYKELRKTTLLYLIIMLLAPFAFQHSDYVLAQYKDIINMLTAVNNVGSTSSRWSQFFGMIEQTSGMTVNAHLQTIIRLIMAIGTLAIMRRIARQYSREESAFFLFTLSSLYLMLFNPRTEANDYVQLAPSIIILLSCISVKSARYLTTLLLALVAGMAFNSDISKLIISDSRNWVAPLSTIILCTYIAWLKLRPQLVSLRLQQTAPYF